MSIFSCFGCFAKNQLQPEAVLAAVQVGATEDQIRKIFGAAHFDAGGPDSERSRAYEVSGAAMVNLTGVEGDSHYGHIVFERGRRPHEFSLVYAKFEFKNNRKKMVEQVLRDAGYMPDAGISRAGCWASSLGQAAVVDTENSSEHRFVLIIEANSVYLKKHGMVGNWMRPSYLDNCSTR